MHSVSHHAAGARRRSQVVLVEEVNRELITSTAQRARLAVNTQTPALPPAPVFAVELAVNAACAWHDSRPTGRIHMQATQIFGSVCKKIVFVMRIARLHACNALKLQQCGSNSFIALDRSEI